MLSPTHFLALVLSPLALAACGGGGDGGASTPATVAAPVPVVGPVFILPSVPAPGSSLASLALQKYEGIWQQPCVDHVRRRTALIATGTNVFAVTPIEEHFANKDCTGAVVATGSYGGPRETVIYGPATPATVTLEDKTTKISNASVNPGRSTFSVAKFTFAGTGVTSTTISGIPVVKIQYADGYFYPSPTGVNGGTNDGGLLFLDGSSELLALQPEVPGSTVAFVVYARYTP